MIRVYVRVFCQSKSGLMNKHIVKHIVKQLNKHVVKHIIVTKLAFKPT